jgi:regulator of cell morphogenesis and NO signaling
MQNGKARLRSQIVADTPTAAQVFDNSHTDYSCGGNDPLENACGEAEVRPDRILEEIPVAAQTEIPTDLHDWQNAPMRDLISHIINEHHAFIEVQLPLLENKISRSVEMHAKDTDESSDRLRQIFRQFREEIERHNKREEMVLFPAIIALELATESNWRGPKNSFGFATETIQSMEGEHESVNSLLAEIRRITNEFTPAANARGVDRSLYRDLREFEANMRRHFHLENNILFPRAAALEDGKL